MKLKFFAVFVAILTQSPAAMARVSWDEVQQMEAAPSDCQLLGDTSKENKRILPITSNKSLQEGLHKKIKKDVMHMGGDSYVVTREDLTTINASAEAKVYNCHGSKVVRPPPRKKSKQEAKDQDDVHKEKPKGPVGPNPRTQRGMGFLGFLGVVGSAPGAGMEFDFRASNKWHFGGGFYSGSTESEQEDTEGEDRQVFVEYKVSEVAFVSRVFPSETLRSLNVALGGGIVAVEGKSGYVIDGTDTDAYEDAREKDDEQLYVFTRSFKANILMAEAGISNIWTLKSGLMIGGEWLRVGIPLSTSYDSDTIQDNFADDDKDQFEKTVGVIAGIKSAFVIGYRW
jgi:hypothetical protein